jgi:putative addiction module killer protein
MTGIYRDWIDGLKDRAARARVQVRVDRVAHGNPGQYRILTGGAGRELNRLWPWVSGALHGAGGVLIVLLAGGDKSSQAKDIKTAIALEKQL